MQQVNCLYCGKETPDASATCIHCGAPSHGARRTAGRNRQRRFVWFFIALTIAVVAAMFILPR